MENQRHPHKRKMTPEEKRRRKEKLFYQRSSKIYFKMAGIFLFFLIIAFAFNLFSKDKKILRIRKPYAGSETRIFHGKSGQWKIHERYGRLCNRPIFYP